MQNATPHHPKRFTALIACLLLLSSQLSVVVHAAEHPFHVADEFCHVYLHAGQFDLPSCDAGAVISHTVFLSLSEPYVETLLVEAITSSYQSRAPPVIV